MTDVDYRKALVALLEIAELNFPSSTTVRIETTGQRGTASIVMPSYVLLGIVTGTAPPADQQAP
jgi:hypothetical protein